MTSVLMIFHLSSINDTIESIQVSTRANFLMYGEEKLEQYNIIDICLSSGRILRIFNPTLVQNIENNIITNL